MPPEPEPGTPHRVRLGDRLLVLVEDVIYVSIAVLLSASALVVLGQAGVTGVKSALAGAPDGMLEVLDALLLVFIFVELLYAVRTTLTERQIVAEPFLLAGILTAIKEIIVLAVKAPTDYLDKGPEFARAMVQIGLLGVLVAVLSLAAVLLRRKEKEPEENSGSTPGSAEQKQAARQQGA